jgi:hypothetical protein
MDAYCTEIRELEGHFEGIELQHVPRNNNVVVDVLSKLGSRRALVPVGVFVQDQRKPSIKLLHPDNPEPPSNDQNSAPLRDVLMSEKRGRAQALHRLYTRPACPRRQRGARKYHAVKC